MERFKEFLNESQDPQEVEKVYNKVADLLTSGEEIIYIAVQKKPALNISPDSIALTNKRIIFCQSGNFGLTMNFEDYLWKEVADCHIKEAILGSVFTVRDLNGGTRIVEYLPKAQARLLYRYAQEKEEEMTEYRRQRELEDSRARAGGGITVNTTPDNKEEPAAQDDAMASLKKLKSFFEADLITREEYDLKKKEIMDRL